MAQWPKRIGAMSFVNVGPEVDGRDEDGACPTRMRAAGPTRDKASATSPTAPRKRRRRYMRQPQEPENESTNRYETTGMNVGNQPVRTSFHNTTRPLTAFHGPSPLDGLNSLI